MTVEVGVGWTIAGGSPPQAVEKARPWKSQHAQRKELELEVNI